MILPVQTAESALRCRGLAKRYGDVVAVAGLDLEVQRAECFGMLGPNGAGKTTAVEIFEGLRSPDSGEVEVLGDRWRGDGLALRRRHTLLQTLDALPRLLAVVHDQLQARVQAEAVAAHEHDGVVLALQCQVRPGKQQLGALRTFGNEPSAEASPTE